MKKIKSIIAFVLIASTVIYSCSDNNSVDQQAVAQKSISLRAAMNQIKKANNISGRLAQSETICFDFVYPITLAYNNGNQVVVASFEGLLDVLTQENNNFYIDAIVFPFQVTQNGTTLTISNEDDFHALIDDCGYNTVEEDFYLFDCYDITYPFSVVLQNNQTVVITSQQAFFDLLSGSGSNTPNYVVDFVYPITLTGNGETIVISNVYELFDTLSQCDTSNSCICTAEVNPVCVNDPINFITITFGNACLAACEGYTAADFVDCNPTSTDNFATQLGTCFNLNYIVEIIQQNTIIAIDSNSALLANWSPNQSDMPNFVYPISVNFISTNTTVAVNSQSHFIQLISQNCN